MNTPPHYIDVTAPPFNAAGDGKTDDALAFQRAVDSLAGDGIVILPDGTALRERRRSRAGDAD
jgi:polygalacturonase